jgi:hypothetical protein
MRLSIHWLAKWFNIDDGKNEHRPPPTGPFSNYLLCACLCTFLLSANCVLFPLHDSRVGYCCSWKEYVQFKQGERAGGQLESFPLDLSASRPLMWWMAAEYGTQLEQLHPLRPSPTKRNLESYLKWMPFKLYGLNGPGSNPGRGQIYVLPNDQTDTAPPLQVFNSMGTGVLSRD